MLFRRLLLAGLAGALWAPQAFSQSEDYAYARRLAGTSDLFIAPCGKPYRGKPGDPYPVAVWFAEADANHDGFIDRTEFKADCAAFFAVLDRNGDGVIDTQEVAYYERVLVPEILRPPAAADGPQADSGRILKVQYSGAGGGPSAASRGEPQGLNGEPPSVRPPPIAEMIGAAPYNLLAEPEPVTAADASFNQRITLAEFISAANRRFDALDVNKTGRLALEDLPHTAVQPRTKSTRRR
jgi:RimJ/RimL family protein N-acetyltransferase